MISIFALAIGEMPEWSIGPHSKCGERATVPGVRIPLSPQKANEAKRCRAFDTFRFSVVSLQIYLHKMLRKTGRSTEKKQQRPQPLLFHAYATQRY